MKRAMIFLTVVVLVVAWSVPAEAGVSIRIGGRSRGRHRSIGGSVRFGFPSHRRVVRTYPRYHRPYSYRTRPYYYHHYPRPVRYVSPPVVIVEPPAPVIYTEPPQPVYVPAPATARPAVTPTPTSAPPGVDPASGYWAYMPVRDTDGAMRYRWVWLSR